MLELCRDRFSLDLVNLVLRWALDRGEALSQGMPPAPEVDGWEAQCESAAELLSLSHIAILCSNCASRIMSRWEPMYCQRILTS